VHRERTLRPGLIVFRAPDSEATFAVRVGETGWGGIWRRLRRTAARGEGDPRRIQAILRGEKDARKQFFAGGIQYAATCIT
jgi:hypothetical protein